MNLSGAPLRLSKNVARNGRRYGTSARFDRMHTMNDRIDRLPLGTLELDGDHGIEATTLTVKAPSGDPLRGRIPVGLLITLGANAYSVLANVQVDRQEATVDITIPAPGLIEARLDGSGVDLASKIETIYQSVVTRAASSRSLDRALSMGTSVTTTISIPGHEAPRFVETGDNLEVIYGDGRTAAGTVSQEEATVWGQRVTF